MIGFIVLGLIAGILSGIIGIGGGVLIVPALVYLFAVPQKMAQGTTLALFLVPVGAFAIYNYYKAGFVDFRITILIALGFVFGALIGSKIAIDMPTGLLTKIFGIAIILIGIRMLFGK